MSYAKLTLIGLTFKRIGTAWARRHDSAYAGAYALHFRRVAYPTLRKPCARLECDGKDSVWWGKEMWGGVGWGNDDMQTR